jgi:hypothetical protein
MRPRDWLRLFVPGICVGMLPACSNSSINSRADQSLAGQSPGFTRLANFGYGSGQPPALSAGSMATRGALPELKHSASFPAQSFFQTGPASTPYGPIQYGPYDSTKVSKIEAIKRSPLPTRPQIFSEFAVDDPQVAPQDRFLEIATTRSAGESPTIVEPLTLPGTQDTKDESPPAKLPPTVAEEPPLLHAVRCYLEKRPDDFRETIKSLDAAQRDVVQTLIPLLVHVGEGGLAKTDTREAAAAVDQLQALLWVLRPLAPLIMDKFCFCQQVTKFGQFRALESKPSFRSGDMVDVYAEIRNVCSQRRRSDQGDFRTYLRSRLEIRAPSGEVVHVVMCGKPDETSTPQHDYFQHYRFQIPDMPPGNYTLNLEANDVPTGRKVKQKLEFQVSQ